MKKIILSLGALVALGMTSYAQQEVKFGPKAGVNLANLSGLDEADMKTSFHVGAVAEIKFSDKFSLQPELLYSAQGAKYSETYPVVGEVETKMNLDYITIPVLAKYYIVEGFSVEAGPQIGFLVKAEGEVEGGDSSGTTDIKDNLNATDFGLAFGLAYDLPIGLFFGARYNLGLSDLPKDNTGDAVKNSVIQVSVGYKF